MCVCGVVLLLFLIIGGLSYQIAMFLAGLLFFSFLGRLPPFFSLSYGWIRSLLTEMIALDRRVLFFSLIPRNGYPL